MLFFVVVERKITGLFHLTLYHKKTLSRQQLAIPRPGIYTALYCGSIEHNVNGSYSFIMDQTAPGVKFFC